MVDLKTLRLRKFLTQKQLADMVGVPYQTVQRWESGRSAPRPSYMKKLAEVLGISGEELLDAIRAAQGAASSETEAA